MSRFRKRPVEVEAVQLDERNARTLAGWAGGEIAWQDGGVPYIIIPFSTLDGAMRADIGDWIIQGVQGEFYPCKDSVFQSTYERCDGEAQGA